MKSGDIIYSRYIQNEQGGFDRQIIGPASIKPVAEPKPVQEVPCAAPAPKPCKRQKADAGFSALLQRCLKRNLDAGDLLIILILILILTEQEADSVTIALTLAFFLLL